MERLNGWTPGRSPESLRSLPRVCPQNSSHARILFVIRVKNRFDMRVQVVAGAACLRETRYVWTRGRMTSASRHHRCRLQLKLTNAQSLFTDVDPGVGLRRNACDLDLCSRSRPD